MFSKCTPSGTVQGNILLDFDEDDPLLLVARLGLATTITLAFPMLVIPARDILVRAARGAGCGRRCLRPVPRSQYPESSDAPGIGVLGELVTVEFEPLEILEEPLLERLMASSTSNDSTPNAVGRTTMSLRQLDARDADDKAARTLVALVVFWSAAGIATSVHSIDAVWDLLGSSFSIMLAFLIPCGAFLRLSGREGFHEARDRGLGIRHWMTSRVVARIMILFFAPLMVVSTVNACYNRI